MFNDKIFFTSSDENFYCLNLRGEEVWRFKTGGKIWSKPLIFKNRIYFGSFDCHLYCLTLEGK
ncbi:MAG: PQQ-like beta-propeller repeat protein, partial [Candidatus Aenigmatarchaeota archaeon]